MDNIHISLIPDLPLSFFESIEIFLSFRTYCEINLPFHLTLYSFEQVQCEDINDIYSLLPQIRDLLPKGGVKCMIDSPRCFEHNNKQTVYYIPVLSDAFSAVHEKIETCFSTHYPREYPFLPHLSLFFPHDNLTTSEYTSLINTFSNISSLNFSKLVIFREKNHLFRIEKCIKL